MKIFLFGLWNIVGQVHVPYICKKMLQTIHEYIVTCLFE